MTTNRPYVSGMRVSPAISKAMIVGVALVATGGLLGLFGMVVSGSAMASGIRRWLMAQSDSPSEIVRRKVAQTKAATAAGASAWQENAATPVAEEVNV